MSDSEQNVDYRIDVICRSTPDDYADVVKLSATLLDDLLDDDDIRLALPIVPEALYDDAAGQMTLTWFMQRAGDLRDVMHFFLGWLDSNLEITGALLPLLTASDSSMRITPLSPT